MPAKPVKTETVVRTYSADGALLNQTTTTVEVETPAPVGPPDTGLYL